MHLPPKFAETDTAVLGALADRHPFAALLTESADEGCTVSHVPASFPVQALDGRIPEAKPPSWN